MPITPKYHRQRGLPGRLGTPRAVAPSGAIVGAAAEELGKVIEYRGLQMKQQFDESKIAAGYNEFRDVARTKLSELLSLRGEQATGLGAKYDDWYSDFYSDYINKRFSNATQQEGWRARVENERQNDLDRLAQHEAREMVAFRDQQEAAAFTNTANDINSEPWNHRAFEDRMGNFISTLEGLHAGENIDALKDKYIKQFHYGRLQAMINEDAIRAGDEIEKYKDLVGPEAYSRLVGMQREEEAKQIYNNAIDMAESLFPNDFDKQEDWVLKQDYNRQIKQRLISYIRGNEEEQREREAQYKKEQREIIYNEIFENLRNDNFGLALRVIENADVEFLSEIEKFNLEERINNLREHKSNENDPAADEYWFQRIRISPENVDPSKLLTDQRLTTSRRGQYHDWWLRRMSGESKADDKRLGPMLAIMETKYKNAGYLSNDEFADFQSEDHTKSTEMAMLNQQRYQQDKMDLILWAEQNPDAPVFDYYGKEQVEEVKKSNYLRQLRKFFIPGGVSSPMAELYRRQAQRTIPEPKMEISPIPAKDREKAIKILQDNNYPITEDNIKYILDQIKETE